MKRLLAFIIFLLIIPTVSAASITSCTNITNSGEYVLANDIDASGYTYCINISASNVILDCQGHEIYKGGSDAHLIYFEGGVRNNITIRNCILNETDWGIKAYDLVGSNWLIENNVFKNIDYGFYNDANISNLSIINNTFYNNRMYGIAYCGGDNHCENVYIANNKVYCEYSGCGYGGISGTGINVTIENNYVENISSCTDGGIAYFCKDIAHCGNARIINNTVIDAYMGITLPGARNVLVKNNIVRGSSYVGVIISTTDNGMMEDNIVTDSDIGIGFSDYNFVNPSDVNTTNITIRRNWIEGNTYGLMETLMVGTGYFTDIYIYNNFFNQTTNVFIQDPDRFFGYWNTTRQSGTRIYSAGIEIGGNYWTDPSGNGFSDTCTDADKDGFCDSPFTIATNNIDYLPLSDEYSPPVSPLKAYVPLLVTILLLGTLFYFAQSFYAKDVKEFIALMIGGVLIAFLIVILIQSLI